MVSYSRKTRWRLSFTELDYIIIRRLLWQICETCERLGLEKLFQKVFNTCHVYVSHVSSPTMKMQLHLYAAIITVFAHSMTLQVSVSLCGALNLHGEESGTNLEEDRSRSTTRSASRSSIRRLSIFLCRRLFFRRLHNRTILPCLPFCIFPPPLEKQNKLIERI